MKYGILAVVYVMLSLVLVNLIVLFVLGTTVSSKDYPLMVVGRYISIGQVFENLESFIMAIWILGAFVKISVFYYVTAIVTANWLNVSTVKPLVWPIGILIVEFSFWALPSRTEVERYDNFTFPFLWCTDSDPNSTNLISYSNNKKSKKEECIYMILGAIMYMPSMVQ